MEIKGDQIWHSPSPAELLAAAGQEINLKACVHNIRELGGIAFVVLRTGRYLIQSVYDKEVCPDNNLSQLSAGDCVRATACCAPNPALKTAWSCCSTASPFCPVRLRRCR